MNKEAENIGDIHPLEPALEGALIIITPLILPPMWAKAGGGRDLRCSPLADQERAPADRLDTAP
jgi:hypothetical protein